MYKEPFKNKMSIIAGMLGVELGETFTARSKYYPINSEYKLGNDGLRYITNGLEHDANEDLIRFLTGFFEVVKLPQAVPDNIDIEPCPFCGRKKQLGILIEPFSKQSKVYTLECKCGASIKLIAESKDEVIKQWNERQLLQNEEEEEENDT